MAFAGADEFFDRTQYEYCLQTDQVLAHDNFFYKVFMWSLKIKCIKISDRCGHLCLEWK